MIDDTRGSQASLGAFEFSTNINDILTHQIHRTKAAQWARNLRFLTFAGDEAASYTGIPEGSNTTKRLHQGQCTRCELRAPPPVGHICAAHARMGMREISANEKEAKECKDPCIHVQDASCEECMHIPQFPNHGKATKFRIRRLKPKSTKQSDSGICAHYVAVSYCWCSSSAQNSGEPDTDGEHYEVLEEDMKTVRPIRAPKDTIDRAVNFAAQNGFRMIWIDQECIEQDNKDEKELGIQAMDYLYVNAQMSIGLFQVILEQRHFDALLLVFESSKGSEMRRRGPKPVNRCRSFPTKTLAEALSMIVLDRWNTRAWILQEAFASRGHMTLLLPRARDIAVKGWSLICHDLSLTEVGIKLDMLQQCIEDRTGLLTPRLGPSVPINLPNWGLALDRLVWFHPEQSGWHRHDFWFGSSKPRPTCNAAVAWSYLKHRDNDRVADRLAILANLCDYSLRLNTWELEKSQRRLSVCVLALTVANGDFSLLSPECYQVSRALPITQEKSDKDFTWVPSDVKQLQYIKMRDADFEGATLGRASSLAFWVTNEGLSLFGSMWKVDQFVEVPSIRDKYQESWSRLWRPNTRLEEQSLYARKNFHTFHTVTRTRYLAATQIIFEVIKLLHKKDQTEIADAVWHSVTDIAWRKGDCLDSVSRFPKEVTLQRRKGMFRLERSHDEYESFQQKWLIDRIMLHGGFWIGRLVRRSTDHEYSDEKFTEDGKKDTASGDDQVDRTPEDQNLRDEFCIPGQKPNMENSITDPVLGAFLRARRSGQRTHFAAGNRSVLSTTPHYRNNQAESSDPLPRSESDNKRDVEYSISDYQTTLYILTKTVNDTMMDWDDYEEQIDKSDGRNKVAGAFQDAVVDIAVMVNNIDGRNSPSYLRQQRAIFDLEGDPSGQVLVLTPFQKRLETIPRPEGRGMSVSWVVQPVPNHVDGSEDEGKFGFMTKRETLKTVGMVRGMWKFMVQPTNRYVLV